MRTVGIRELRQNPANAIAAAKVGEVVVITDHGVAVAQLTPLPATAYERAAAAGKITPPTRDPRTIGPPLPRRDGPTMSQLLAAAREHER
jgi:prevent-host-death family protein